jgi:FAD/FMN-containing dehydrogenase
MEAEPMETTGELTRKAPSGDAAILRELADAVGAENLISDPAAVADWCQDVFTTGPVALAVVRPGSTAEVAAAARVASAAGLSLVPRGGGLSYTSGYLPTGPRSVLVELDRMDRIVEVNLEDMYVTVEPGCTWAAIREALKGKGVRTPYGGPLSGLKSTVGGAMSQNSVWYGAGVYGTAADTAVSLEVVLADGSIVTTGSAVNRDASPFFRHYGPDLTGLFTGDNGAFGVKTRITLRLIPEPADRRFASFTFQDPAANFRAMAQVAREGLAAECFAFDPYLQKARMVRESVLTDVRTLSKVVSAKGSLLGGLVEGAKMVAAGRGFLDPEGFSLHLVVEGETEASTAVRLERARAIALAEGGREVENTIPKVIHASPFPQPNSMLGPRGERWVPVHCVVPHSRAIPLYEAIEAVLARRKEEIARHEVGIGYLNFAVGHGATNIELVFHWKDELTNFHRREVEKRVLDRMDRFPPNPEARAFVTELRAELKDLMRRHGSTHFQVAKSYPLQQAMAPDTAALLQRIKRAVDPEGLMNPGCLGLT